MNQMEQKIFLSAQRGSVSEVLGVKVILRKSAICWHSSLQPSYPIKRKLSPTGRKKGKKIGACCGSMLNTKCKQTDMLKRKQSITVQVYVLCDKLDYVCYVNISSAAVAKLLLQSPFVLSVTSRCVGVSLSLSRRCSAVINQQHYHYQHHPNTNPDICTM